MNAFVRYTVMGIYKLFYNFKIEGWENVCLLYTSPSPRDA